MKKPVSLKEKKLYMSNEDITNFYGSFLTNLKGIISIYAQKKASDCGSGFPAAIVPHGSKANRDWKVAPTAKKI